MHFNVNVILSYIVVVFFQMLSLKLSYLSIGRYCYHLTIDGSFEIYSEKSSISIFELYFLKTTMDILYAIIQWGHLIFGLVADICHKLYTAVTNRIVANSFPLQHRQKKKRHAPQNKSCGMTNRCCWGQNTWLHLQFKLCSSSFIFLLPLNFKPST